MLAGLSVGAVVGYLLPFLALAADMVVERELGLVGEGNLFF